MTEQTGILINHGEKSHTNNDLESDVIIIDKESSNEVSQPIEMTQGIPEKKKFRIVFYVKYRTTRPNIDVITNVFSNYGVVDHVKTPADQNYAFVFMENINSPDNQIRSTIGSIIRDQSSLDPSNRFYVNVAKSRHPTDNTNINPNNPIRNNFQRQYNNNQTNLSNIPLRNNFQKQYNNQRQNIPNDNMAQCKYENISKNRGIRYSKNDNRQNM